MGSDFLTQPMRQTLRDVLGGRPIREYEAAHLARIFDTTPDLWLSLQANYDNCQHPSSILSGDDIRRLCQGDKPMISPFSEKKRWHGISGGLDYHGYCIHLGNRWMTSTAPIVDMKNIAATKHLWTDETADSYTLAPGACVLAVSQERFIVPKNVFIRSFGKSTFAREGGDTIITPFEAGWEGYPTIEIVNHNKSKAIKLWSGMPITQLVFEWVQAGSGYDGIYQHQQQAPVSALGNK